MRGWFSRKSGEEEKVIKVSSVSNELSSPFRLTPPLVVETWRKNGGFSDNAGIDLFVVPPKVKVFILDNVEINRYISRFSYCRTGTRIQLPPGVHMQIAPRSGKMMKKGMLVGEGVIDSSYRGEIIILCQHLIPQTFSINMHNLPKLIDSLTREGNEEFPLFVMESEIEGVFSKIIQKDYYAFFDFLVERLKQAIDNFNGIEPSKKLSLKLLAEKITPANFFGDDFEAVAQGILLNYKGLDLTEYWLEYDDDLDVNTRRGEAGFGSTGN